MSKEIYGKRWPEDYRFRFFYGNHVVNATPALPDLMKQIDGRALVRRLADAGVETISTYAAVRDTFMYPTEVKPGCMHPSLKGRDFFGEVAEECQRLKIPFIGAWLYAIKVGPREWRHYYPTALPNNAGDGCCYNTGYGEFLQQVMAELAARYPMAGVFIDGLNHPGLVCCEGCARRFKEAVGAAPPRVKDIRSPLYQAFKLWTYRDTARYMMELKAIIQSHQPGATFVQNFHLLSGADLYEVAEAEDYIYTDPGIAFGFNATNGGAVGLGALMGIFCALARGKPPFEMLLDNLNGPHGLLSVVPLEAYEAILAMLEARGGAGGPGSLMDQAGRWNEACVAMTKAAGAFSSKRRSWPAEGEPVRFAGLYLSQESAWFYGAEQPSAGKYMDEFHGAWLMLQQEHWPTDVLTRRDLKRLAEYPVIYLANAVCLSDEECAAFREYVESGGTLVASYRTSLSNEWHDPRRDFGLADVFGVRFKGRKIEPSAALQMPLPEGVFDTLPWENRNISLPQAALVCEAVDQKDVWVPLHDRYRRSANMPDLHNGGHIYMREDPFGPGLVAQAFGKGRCFYFAGKIFSAYRFTGIPSLRRLATRWILPESVMARLPIRLRAPDSVELTAWSQPDRDRMLVHLVNFQSVPGRLGLPAPEIPETEQILPVIDLEMEIAFNRNDIREIVLQPDGQSLPAESGAKGTVIRIPKIHIHHIVEIRFRKGRCPRYPDSRKILPYARFDLRERVQRWIASRPAGYDPKDPGTYSFEKWIEPEAFIVNWHVVGPFDRNAADVLSAEPQPDLQARYGGLNGESIGWAEMNGLEQNRNGFVEMCVQIGNQRGTAGYAMTVLKSDKARQAVFRVGNDDPCRIWVNGKLSWEDAGSETRDLYPDKAEFTAELRQGENIILVRKINIGHGMGFYLRQV